MYFEQNLSTKAFALDLRNRSLNYTQYMANKLTKLEINYDQFYIIKKLFFTIFLFNEQGNDNKKIYF